MKLSPDTHEQAMACLACGLAGMTPPDYFPQEPGLWDRPCPSCGAEKVWVAEPLPKSEGGLATMVEQPDGSYAPNKLN